MQRKDSKLLNPGHMFRTFKGRNTRQPIDHLGRSVSLERNKTPPFGRTTNVEPEANVFFESKTFHPLRSSHWSKPNRCPLCAVGAKEAEEFRNYKDLVRHVMEEHTDIYCDSTEFVCTDKMFQVSVEDRDYDELNDVRHGYFMSCEEAFSNIISSYFHYCDIHLLEDHCDICGKWMPSRKGSLIDHYTWCHNGKNNQNVGTCPECGERFNFFNDMLKHVMEKHVKIMHLCHVCLTSGDGKKEGDQEIKGVFKSREAWLDHVQKAHAGTLVADVVIRGSRVNKSLLNQKVPPMDCVICQKRGERGGGGGSAGNVSRIVTCKTLQQTVDHIYEEHVGEGFICWSCGKIRKYTDVKHLRECVLQLAEFFDMRNIRTDKKLWYAFHANRRRSSAPAGDRRTIGHVSAKTNAVGLNRRTSCDIMDRRRATG